MDNRPESISASDNVLWKVRQRTQQKVAGQLLEAGENEGSKVSDLQNSRLSQYMDKETQDQFENRFGGYHTKESAYSIQNVLWLIGAIGIFYYTDFYVAARYDPRVNRTWFNIGAVLISINICIALFLIVWLSLIKKVSSDEWEARYPVAIPIATGAFILGGVCVTVGLWPLWSILTPFILFILFMGLIVTLAMLPNF